MDHRPAEKRTKRLVIIAVAIHYCRIALPLLRLGGKVTRDRRRARNRGERLGAW